MDGATMVHLQGMLRTMKYVIATRNKVHMMEPNQRTDDLWSINAFSDSDCAGDCDSRISITGYVVYVLGATVAWKSKSQKSMTLSSSEAEYAALSEKMTDVLFVKHTLKF